MGRCCMICKPRERAEQGQSGEVGEGGSCTRNRMLTWGLTDPITSESSLGRSEVVGHREAWGKASRAEPTSSAKSLRKMQVLDQWAGVGGGIGGSYAVATGEQITWASLAFPLKEMGNHCQVLLLIFFFFNFLFELILDWQELQRAPMAPLPFTQLPLMFTSCITIVHWPNLRNQLWCNTINLTADFIWIFPFFHFLFSVSGSRLVCSTSPWRPLTGDCFLVFFGLWHFCKAVRYFAECASIWVCLTFPHG